MKQHLASLPRLASVSPGEKLGLYLVASQHAVNSVLIKENSGEQLPVYYVSHVLNGPEERYPPIEKLALALVLSARKLHPYFQAHPVEAITDQPLRQILSEFDVAGQLTQTEDTNLEQPPEAWVLHVDGSANSKGAGAGLVLLAPDGRLFERSLRFGFQATNNEAEYKALLAGLRLALEMQVVAIHVLTDSQLVAEQLGGGYEARDPIMAKYLAQVKNLTAKFPHFTLYNVPRGENERADALAKLASKPASGARPEVDELPTRAIEIAAAVSGGAPTTWVQELLCFKRDGTLPPDEATGRRLRHTHALYSEVGGRLYSLVTRFGLPKTIITDNGPQFASRRFREFCASHGIQLKFSSVAHPQMNGLAEVTNRSILDGLKRRVSAARSAWTDELPSVLWSLRTTPKTATGESPYSLTFRTEAVLPPEVAIPTLRTRNYDEKITDEGLRASLDMLEERRADAHLKALSYKRAVARVYNRKVRPRPIKLNDLVLCKTEVSDPTRARGKLAPKWEGPYRVVEVIRPGTYRLATMDGSSLPRAWNVQNLRKFFV
uniref:Uncharacterized protein n=1 Tax=Musa acuminata subsp. malaccensis TaxID=214687 RepID=A0A804HWW3_MUSAM